MQDGARTFANYCMGCHSAKFQRYERVATDLGISCRSDDGELVFTGAKIGDHMDIGMKPADAKDLVRRRSAGSDPGCPRTRHRLAVQLPALVLRGSQRPWA